MVAPGYTGKMLRVNLSNRVLSDEASKIGCLEEICRRSRIWS
jgi:hypothetical protein